MSTPGLRDFTDPARFEVTEADRNLFKQTLADFIPPNAFDAHAHWYDMRHLGEDAPSPDVGHTAMLSSMRRWMGDSTITEGLYFGYPIRQLDCAAANRFIASEVKSNPACRGLMLVRPDDDPAVTESTLRNEGFSGF